MNKKKEMILKKQKEKIFIKTIPEFKNLNFLMNYRFCREKKRE